jgi:hypothetical protein
MRPEIFLCSDPYAPDSVEESYSNEAGGSRRCSWTSPVSARPASPH